MGFFDKLFGDKEDSTPNQTFQQLWDQLVPDEGQAPTVQGELIRAIGRMSNEFLANGYANWDEGYEILSAYLLSFLTDGSFGELTTSGIKQDIESIQMYGRGESIEYDFEGAHDRLTQATVAWCQKHSELEPHNKNESLKR